jgi:hypothetical protein
MEPRGLRLQVAVFTFHLLTQPKILWNQVGWFSATFDSIQMISVLSFIFILGFEQVAGKPAELRQG